MPDPCSTMYALQVGVKIGGTPEGILMTFSQNSRSSHTLLHSKPTLKGIQKEQFRTRTRRPPVTFRSAGKSATSKKASGRGMNERYSLTLGRTKGRIIVMVAPPRKAETCRKRKKRFSREIRPDVLAACRTYLKQHSARQLQDNTNGSFASFKSSVQAHRQNNFGFPLK